MQPQDHTAALEQLDRAAAEHLTWLKRVHCSVVFRDNVHALPPDIPEILVDWSRVPDVSGAAAAERMAAMERLRRARQRMVLRAAVLTERTGGGLPLQQDDYHAFMASVEAYGEALRRVETMLRQAMLETDPLTGVLNRHGMMRDLEREWQRSMRTGQPCCVAIADLDHFKAVNDIYGHPAGDAVLSMAARFFVRRLRPYDRVYRYGGEEFLFCLPDTEIDQAERVLNRLRMLMARVPMPVGDRRYTRVTTSIGIASMADEETPPMAAIAHADSAVYAAKEAGRNRVRVATIDGGALDGDAVRHLALGAMLGTRRDGPPLV